MTKGDEDFKKVLKEPFYQRIREALYSESNSSNGVLEHKENNIIDGILEEKEIKIVDGVLDQETVKIDPPEEHCTTKEVVKEQCPVSEIEEVEGIVKSHEDDNDVFLDCEKEISVLK